MPNQQMSKSPNNIACKADMGGKKRRYPAQICQYRHLDATAYYGSAMNQRPAVP